jgi:hypothetical protein
MNTRILVAFAALAVCATHARAEDATSISPLPSAAATTQAKPAVAPPDADTSDDATGKKWLPLTGMDHQIFPATIITMATSKKPFSVIGLRLKDAAAGTKVRVAVTCDALMEPLTKELTVDKTAAEQDVPLSIHWKYDALARIHQQKPINFSFRVSLNGVDTGEKIDTPIVHSVNDCLYAFKRANGQWLPMFPLFAGYVNEDSPKIDKLLKDALATHIVKEFDGYQSKDPQKVGLQVLAVWNTLQQRGIKYSNVTDIATKSDLVLAQHVRFPSESIENAQANCVDGSVALASILQKIGIDTILVATNGHMFLAFYAKPDHQHLVALETTLLGAVDLPKDLAATDLLDEHWRADASTKTFLAALNAGNTEYRKLAAEAAKQKTAANPKFVCERISISEARKAGFMPIPDLPESH